MQMRHFVPFNSTTQWPAENLRKLGKGLQGLRIGRRAHQSRMDCICGTTVTLNRRAGGVQAYFDLADTPSRVPVRIPRSRLEPETNPGKETAVPEVFCIKQTQANDLILCGLLPQSIAVMVYRSLAVHEIPFEFGLSSTVNNA